MNQVGLKTDKGIKRDINEDAYGVLPSSGVYMVADGVGGNNAGEIASKAAVDEVCQFIQVNPIEDVKNPQELEQYLRRCITNANDTVYAIGKKNPENRGLATTLVLCLTGKDEAFFVNVGDSRAYICRDEKLFKITEDHSYVNTLVKHGVITRKQAETHPKGNAITRAVGAERDIKADLYRIDIMPGDIILLCTDGLYHEVSEENILQVMIANEDVNEMAEELVDQANSNGGRDNITVVAIKILGGENEQ